MNILHTFKTCAALATVALVAASCTEEQSSLNIGDMPSKAIINGTISYSEGTILTEGKFQELIKPAANKKIDILLNNSSYKNEAEGNTLYKTIKTNAQGRYSIEIPVPVDGDITVCVRPHDFQGEFNSVKRDNNELKEVKDTVFFSAEEATVAISSRDIKVQNFTFNSFETQDQIELYKTHVTLNGVIGKRMEKYYKPELVKIQGEDKPEMKAPYRRTYFDGAANANLMVNITYNNNTRLYNCTTDANGKFSLNIPVIEFPCEISYSIEAIPFKSDYTFYEQIEKEWTKEDIEEWHNNYIGEPYSYDYTSKALKGYYYSFYGDLEKPEPETINFTVNEPKEIKLKLMEFMSFDETNITQNGDLWLEELLEEEKNQNK